MNTKVCDFCGKVFSKKPGWSNPAFARVRFCSKPCGDRGKWLGERGARYRRRLGAARRAYNEAHPDENRARVAKTAATRGMAFPGIEPKKVGRARAASVLALERCADCGKPYEGSRSLHRHHINGDTSDNALTNLVVVCRPCHLTRHGGSYRTR